jgi:hypothetical protein
MQLSKPPKPKATRKRLKKEILSDDFEKRKIFWKNIAENFLETFPYGKIFHIISLLRGHMTLECIWYETKYVPASVGQSYRGQK